MSSATNRNICIIGGGPSGLSTLRRVLDSPKLTGTLFELKDDVGGLWNYKGNKSFKINSNLVQTTAELAAEDPEYVATMYDDLRANLAHTSMTLEDFPYTKSEKTFLTQEEVHTYFRDYATHFNLWPHIQLNTAVVNVLPEDPLAPYGKSTGRWIVKTYNQKEDNFRTEIFDAIVIATGCNTFPCQPKIPGLEHFQGNVLHSKYFKNPKEFQDKDVVLVGLGPSSGDLGVLLSKTCKSVTICHKFPMGFKFGIDLPNFRETKNVKGVTPDGVITVENEYIKCNTIILCTGYIMKFPFLDEECGLVVKENGKYISHLYEMMIFSKRPTLAILNVLYRAPEIKITEIQAKYYVAYLEGKIQLPSYEQMESEINAEDALKKQQGVPYSEWYQVGTFGLDYWDYCAKLIDKTGIQDQYKYFPLHIHLWKTAIMRLFGQYTIYKNDSLKIVNEREWEYYFSADPNDKESKPKKMIMRINSDDGELTTETVELQ